MLVTILVFILVLSILVFVHEAGHFFVAKRLGIGVEEFGFGLPPRAWGKRVGETIYSLNWLPIGGFVRLAGEDQEQKQKDKITDKSKLRRLFWARSKKERTAVLLAGVTMNFVLAAVLFSVIYSAIGIPTPTESLVVVGVQKGSLAAQSGFEYQDIITSLTIGGRETSTDVSLFFAANEESLGEKLEARILRDGQMQNITLVLPERSPVIFSGIASDSPAESVGLEAGDRVEAVQQDDERTIIIDSKHFSEYIKAHKGQQITLTVLREGKEIETKLTPRVNPPENQGAIGVSLTDFDVATIDDWNLPFRGSISGASGLVPWGIAVSNIELMTYPVWQMPFRGAYFGVQQALVWGSAIVFGLYRLIRDIFATGNVPRDVAGPVGIFQLTGEVAKQGILPLMQFMSMLSLNLAIINILPIPALDGGRLLFIVVEKFIGRKMQPRAEAIAHQVGMAFLLGLILLITINDVLRIVRG